MPRTRAGLAALACVLVAPVAAPAQTGDPVIAAAGDIACDPEGASFNGGEGTADRCHQKHTSDLLVGTGLAAVLALGDNQYEEGTLDEFQGSYDPSWGRVKSVTHPVIGNHEYREPLGVGTGHWDYYNGVGVATGPAGERGKGWYSFDIGDWHLIALNSMCDKVAGGCGPGSEQEQWLRADLAANSDAACTLAYWHHPLFNSGPEGGYADTPRNTTALWQALWEAGADVVVNAHSHAYERFALQDPQGSPDTLGLRQFIVGTGGRNLGSNGPVQPNSELRDNTHFGVLRLALHPNGYDWTFVSDAGETVDSGSDACHGAPDLTPPETSIDLGPQGAVAHRRPAFTFQSSEPGSTFRCRLDGPDGASGSESECISPQTYSGLADGAYTFSVYAVDAADNSDTTPAMRSFTIDATAPNTAIRSGPGAATTRRNARFAFSSTDDDVEFECRLDRPYWRACESPSSHKGLDRGRHVFRVRAVDAAGNADPKPASHRWTIKRPSKYRPNRYVLESGDPHRSGIRRLYRNDGRRLEIDADAQRSGGFAAAFRVVMSIDRGEAAALRGLGLVYDGGASMRARIAIRIFDFRAGRWVKVHGAPARPRDRRFEWSKFAAARRYVSSTGKVRLRVIGNGAARFRTQTDLIGLTVEY